MTKRSVKFKDEFEEKKYYIAQGMLMSGPKAQPPTERAIRKTMRRLSQGKSVRGGWRSWPNNRGV